LLAIIKNLTRNSVIYGASMFLQKILGFLLLPVYTRFLSPDQFGTYALLNTTGQVVAPLLGVGISHALVWSILYRETQEEETFGTAVIFNLVFGAMLTGLLCWFAPNLSVLVFGSADSARLIQLIFITMFLEMWEFNLIARMRIREQPAWFAVMIGARFVANALLHVVFLVVFNMGIKGLVIAQLINSFIFGSISLFIIWPKGPLIFSTSILKSMLKYGLPTIPMSLGYIVLTASDRYFLQHYASAFEVGLYALGYNIGMVINIATSSLEMGWIPQMFVMAKKDPDAKKTIGKLLTYYVLLIGTAGLGLALLSREIIMILAPSEYHTAARVVPLVVLSYVLGGVTLFTNIGMKIQNRLYFSNPIVIGAALLNLGLNYLLIPRYGMMGAAWATLISYFMQTMAYTAINHVLWSIPYEVGRLFKVSLVLGLVFWVAQETEVSNVWISVLFKLLVMATIPLLLWVTQFFHPREITTFRGIMIKLKTG